jgi:hypothetical protein
MKQTRSTLMQEIKSYKDQIKAAGERMPAISKLKRDELLKIHENLVKKYTRISEDAIN